MLEASRTAQEYVSGIDKAEFLNTRMVQQAVILNLIIIGEAAVQIEMKRNFPTSRETILPYRGKTAWHA